MKYFYRSLIGIIWVNIAQMLDKAVQNLEASTKMGVLYCIISVTTLAILIYFTGLIIEMSHCCYHDMKKAEEESKNRA